MAAYLVLSGVLQGAVVAQTYSVPTWLGPASASSASRYYLKGQTVQDTDLINPVDAKVIDNLVALGAIQAVV